MTIVLHLCHSIRALACFVAHGTGLVAQQDDRLCKGSDLGGVAMNGGGLAGGNGGRYPKHGSKRDTEVRIMKSANCFSTSVVYSYTDTFYEAI